MSGATGKPAAELRRRLRERQAELRELKGDLDWQNSQLQYLSELVRQAKKAANAKLAEYKRLALLRDVFELWSHAVLERLFEQQLQPRCLQVQWSARRVVQIFSRHVDSPKLVRAVLDKWFLAWRMVASSGGLARQVVEEEEEYNRQLRQLQSLRATTMRLESEELEQVKRVQSLDAAVQQVADRANVASRIVSGPLVSMDDLAVVRAEASVRLQRLRTELEELQHGVDRYWSQARPYLVVGLGNEDAKVDPDAVAFALARAVLPLSHSVSADGVLRDLARATGAGVKELPAGAEGSRDESTVPPKRPPLLPENMQLAAEGIAGCGAVFQPAMRNPPLQWRASSSAVDLDRLRAALALLQTSG